MERREVCVCSPQHVEASDNGGNVGGALLALGGIGLLAFGVCKLIEAISENQQRTAEISQRVTVLEESQTGLRRVVLADRVELARVEPRLGSLENWRPTVEQRVRRLEEQPRNRPAGPFQGPKGWAQPPDGTDSRYN